MNSKNQIYFEPSNSTPNPTILDFEYDCSKPNNDLELSDKEDNSFESENYIPKPANPLPRHVRLKSNSKSFSKQAFPGLANLHLEPGQDRVKVGVCCMSVKAKSKPMAVILSHLQEYPHIQIIVFEEDMIISKDVEEWPVVEAFISFYSSGFPLQKAIRYAELYNVFLINDLKMQQIFSDRREVFSILQKHDIPVPIHYTRDKNTKTFEEEDDFITIDESKMYKPFVEKPVSGEDHNVYIYYPRLGGSKRLFRKFNDLSSQFYPDENHIRRNGGEYIYEEFINTEGADVKVYTVGPDYAHAEARKSPAVDGKVLRTPDGKELRYPVALTFEEKEIARKISVIFKQMICGFDLLRSDGKSFVCDVNGFSFVKGSQKYFKDCAQLVCEAILRYCRPGLLTHTFSTGHLLFTENTRAFENIDQGDQNPEELRTVIAVIRHGDRTPKQKTKLKVTQRSILKFFDRNVSKHSQVKLKRPVDLQALLDVVKEILEEEELDENLKLNEETRRKFTTIRNVLETKGRFEGINRKVQIKPLEIEFDQQGEEQVKKALLIVKWGGQLTRLGREQSERLGRIYRSALYPEDNLGMIRLHSSYMHDLKIYASDEGRVQMTAAAFAKSFLELEGDLIPILFSLIWRGSRSNQLLDDSSSANSSLNEIKLELDRLSNLDKDISNLKITDDINGIPYMILKELEFDQLRNPAALVKELYGLINDLCNAIKNELRNLTTREDCVLSPVTLFTETNTSFESKNTGMSTPPCSGRQSLIDMYKCWSKLKRDLIGPDGQYDTSKIPDVFDCIKYDALHTTGKDGLKEIQPVFDAVKKLCRFYVPQKFGITEEQKLEISSGICHRLVLKILSDITNMRDRKQLKTVSRFYFTSESHLHSLLNILKLRLGLPLETNCEVNYLTQIVFRMFENHTVKRCDPRRYRVEVWWSPGADGNPFQDIPDDEDPTDHLIEAAPLRLLSNHFSLDDFEEKLVYLEHSESGKSSPFIIGSFTK